MNLKIADGQIAEIILDEPVPAAMEFVAAMLACGATVAKVTRKPAQKKARASRGLQPQHGARAINPTKRILYHG